MLSSVTQWLVATDCGGDAQKWPFDATTAHVIAFVRRAGFLAATTTRFGLARPAQLYELSRIPVDGRDGLRGFAKKLQGLTR